MTAPQPTLHDQLSASWKLIATYARVGLVDAYWMQDAVDAILERNFAFPFWDLRAGGLSLPPLTSALTLQLVHCWHLIATNAHFIDPVWLKAVSDELVIEVAPFMSVFGDPKEGAASAAAAAAAYERAATSEEGYLEECAVDGDFPLWAGPVAFVDPVRLKIEAEAKRSRIAELREENDACTSSFSRACGACQDENPPKRTCFNTCGHVLCAQCTHKVHNCLICSKYGTAVRMYEEEEKEEQGKLSLSRACHICLSSNPLRRVCLTQCGHLLCFACALQMEKWGRLKCTTCRVEGGFVEMKEEEIESMEMDVVRL